MKTQNLFTMTLIISGLALTPVYALRTGQTIRVTQTAQRTLSHQIILSLTQKGLEQKSAEALVFSAISAEKEAELAQLIKQLHEANIMKAEEVYDYVASLALHKQSVDLSSYDALLGLFMKTKGKAADENKRQQLSQIANRKHKRFT